MNALTIPRICSSYDYPVIQYTGEKALYQEILDANARGFDSLFVKELPAQIADTLSLYFFYDMHQGSQHRSFTIKWRGYERWLVTMEGQEEPTVALSGSFVLNEIVKQYPNAIKIELVKF